MIYISVAATVSCKYFLDGDDVKDYLIILKNDSSVSYIIEDVHTTSSCSENIYFKDGDDKIVAAVAKDGFSLIREVEKNTLNKVFM